MFDFDRADFERGLAEERRRAAADGRPHAFPLDCGMEIDFGAPLPTFMQWEHEAHLFFNLQEKGVGAVVFDGCRCSTLGPPGEDGHELAGSGWKAYTPLRVINSPWILRMFGLSPDLNHFIFPFHDTTFECIAASFAACRFDGSIADAVRAVTEEWD